jgi:hypothetical protein
MRTLLISFPTIVLSLIACLPVPSRLLAAEPIAIQAVTGTGSIALRRADRQILEYRTVASPTKPYIRELFTPAGVQFLRDAVPDHLHHHGLMFAVGVDGVNFWEELPGMGSERPRAGLKTSSTAIPGTACRSFVQTLDWIDGHAKKLLIEHRRIGVVAMQEPVTLLTWNTELATAAGVDQVTLSGQHYYGLGMRFVKSMDNGGRFFSAAQQPGEVVRGSEQLVAAKWCAYSAKVDGKPITVAIFDHPANPRHPNKFFTMTPPFAYLAATLNLWKEPLVLTASERLKLSYAVAAWDGEASAEQVESLFTKWGKLPSK